MVPLHSIPKKLPRSELIECQLCSERLLNTPDAMRIRKRTLEPPFGTLKAWIGATHFQTSTLNRVSTEMSLHVLVYNIKRVVKIVGIGPLIQAIEA
jgi:hypothetical protein